jgi:hypothetical protein
LNIEVEGNILFNFIAIQIKKVIAKVKNMYIRKLLCI